MTEKTANFAFVAETAMTFGGSVAACAGHRQKPAGQESDVQGHLERRGRNAAVHSLLRAYRQNLIFSKKNGAKAPFFFITPPKCRPKTPIAKAWRLYYNGKKCF